MNIAPYAPYAPYEIVFMCAIFSIISYVAYLLKADAFNKLNDPMIYNDKSMFILRLKDYAFFYIALVIFGILSITTLVVSINMLL